MSTLDLAETEINRGTRFSGLRTFLEEGQASAVAPLVKEALEWWRQFDGAPMRRQFDIVDHPHWAAHVFLVKCLNEHDAFEYRIAGEEVIRLIGRNDAKQMFTVNGGSPYGRDFATYLSKIRDSGHPWICRGAVFLANSHRQPFESIDLPLLDEGGHVGWILGLVEPIPLDCGLDIPDERISVPVLPNNQPQK